MTSKQIRATEAMLIILGYLMENVQEAREALEYAGAFLIGHTKVPVGEELDKIFDYLDFIEKIKDQE